MNNAGYLVTVRSPEDRDIRGSLYLWADEKVDCGHRECVLQGIGHTAQLLRNDAVIEIGEISEYSRLHREQPDTARAPHFPYPFTAFIDPMKQEFDQEMFRCGLENWQAGWHHFLPQPRLGAVVRQEDFYGRREFISALKSCLNDERLLVISAPRRYGKTSVLFAFLDRDFDRRAIHVDLEDLESFDRFLARLYVKLMIAEREVSTAEERGVENDYCKSVQAMPDAKKKEEGRSLFRQLDEMHVLLLMDEPGYFVQNLLLDGDVEGRGNALMALRTLAGYLIEFQNIQAVLASSVGLKQFLKYSGLNNTGFEPLREVPLPPLTPDEASRLIRGLLVQGGICDCSRESLETLLEIASPPIPYFIQVLLDEVIKARLPLTPENVRWIYERNVIGPTCRRVFDQLIWHLHHYCPPEQIRAARRILNLVANRPEGRVSRRELRNLFGVSIDENQFDALLQMLEFDCYLVGETQDGEMYYSFNNRMMRDYLEQNPLS